MRKADIEDLAYLIKKSKEKPIVFLGAGASITGDIPIANTIVEDILERYKDNPRVKKDSDKTYKSLMNCLFPDERNTLLKEYIDNAKINVTHIYLAQFIKNELIDYVLTVNFDNLMLRALALYNIYPPTYDMAILKDITTSTFPTKSVIYLHGQHHGLWLLNTEEELKKVKEVIPPILNSIKDRPWIFIGYSANDPIFDHIAKLGRFDKGLYWIARKETSISDKVRKELLDKENTNSFFIEGYDSDSFMLELNTKLELEQPEILEKPFSYLRNCLDNIVDIQDEEHFRGIKERLEIIKIQVSKSIDTYENKDIENNLIKEIIDLSLKENFNEEKINELYKKSQESKNQQLKNALANLFNNWGINLSNLAKIKKDKNLYKKAFEKYKTASELNPNDYFIFNNWGVSLSNFAKAKNDENLFNQAFSKYETASILNPKNDSIFYNWGNALSNFAKAKNDENLFNQAFSKYETASILNPKNFLIFNNWGNALSNFAKAKNDNEDLYKEAFNKYETASILNPKDTSIFYNWGSALSNLAKAKNDNEDLYKEAFNKYETASILNPKNDSIFYNWGSALSNFAKAKNNNENLYKEAFSKYKTASILNPKNDSIFNNWGIALSNLAKANNNDEDLYKEAFNKYETALILNPKDFQIFNNWGTALSDLAKAKNDDENLYKEAFSKYEAASILNPKNDSIFNNWGVSLYNLANAKNDDEDLYKEAFEKLNKAIKLGSGVYNLACYYSIRKNKKEALKLLEKAIENKEITISHILDDEDWDNFKEDEDFKKIIKKYS